MNFGLDSTPADLSLQLSLLAVNDTSVDGSPGAPGDSGPAASTPRRPLALTPLSSPPAPCTPSSIPRDSPSGSAEDGVSLGSAFGSVRTGEDLTAPAAGFLSSDTFYCLSGATKVSFRDRARQKESEDKSSKVTYSMIGGLSSQLDVIRETIELPLKHPELFSNYGESQVAGKT